MGLVAVATREGKNKERTRRAWGSWHYMGAYVVGASTAGAGFAVSPRQCFAMRARWARQGATAGVWAPNVRARNRVIRSASNPTDLWGPRVGAKN